MAQGRVPSPIFNISRSFEVPYWLTIHIDFSKIWYSDQLIVNLMDVVKTINSPLANERSIHVCDFVAVVDCIEKARQEVGVRWDSAKVEVAITAAAAAAATAGQSWDPRRWKSPIIIFQSQFAKTGVLNQVSINSFTSCTRQVSSLLFFSITHASFRFNWEILLARSSGNWATIFRLHAWCVTRTKEAVNLFKKKYNRSEIPGKGG